MATTLQLRRGTTAEIAGTIGAEGEVFVNTDTGQLVVMDGVTLGGTTLATTADVLSGNTIQGMVTFNSTVELKQATLAAGDIVMTKGYYSVGDGGDAVYNIVPRATYPNQNPDNYVDIALNGSLVAVLMSKTIYIEQAGIIASANSTLNATRLRSALYKERPIRARHANTEINWDAHITVTDLNVDLDLNNNTLVIDPSATHDGFIWFKQNYGTVREVTNIATSSGLTVGKTILTVSDASGIAEDDVIKIFANDILNPRNSSGDISATQERVAEYLHVESVNGNQITVRSQLIFDYTDNVRIAPMGNKDLKVSNIKIYREGNGINGNYSIAFQFMGYHHALVENMYARHWGAQFINNHNGYFNTYRGIHGHHLVNDPTNLRLGYVAADYASQLTQWYDLNGNNTRHTYTTGADDTVYDQVNPVGYGGCVRCHVWTGVAHGNNAWAFDTHGDSYECEFHDIAVYSSITDTVPSTGGVQFRGINHKVHNLTYHGHGDNSGNAVMFTNSCASAWVGTIHHKGRDAAIAVYSHDFVNDPAGDYTVDHLIIEDGTFNNVLSSSGQSNVRINKIDMSLKDTADTSEVGYSDPIRLVTGSTLDIGEWNCWFDSKHTTVRPEWPKMVFFTPYGTDILVNANINVYVSQPLWQFGFYDSIVARGGNNNGTDSLDGCVNITYHYDNWPANKYPQFNQMLNLSADSKLVVNAEIYKRRIKRAASTYTIKEPTRNLQHWKLFNDRGLNKFTHEPNTRIIVDNNGILECAGEPIREFGVNHYRLIGDYIGEMYYGDAEPYHWTVSGRKTRWWQDLQEMSNMGIKHFRTFGGMLTAQMVEAWDTPEKIANNVQAIRNLLDSAHAKGLGMMISVFQSEHAIPEYYGEDLATAIHDPASQTRQLMEEIMTQMVEGLWDHPGLAAWNWGNEMNFHLSQAPVMTQQQMRDLFAWFESKVKAVDTTGRLIVNGNIGPWGDGISNSMDDYLASLPGDNPGSMTPYCHTYNNQPLHTLSAVDNYDFYARIRKSAKSYNKAFVIGEYGVTHANLDGGDYGDKSSWSIPDYDGVMPLVALRNNFAAIYNSGVQLSYTWDWYDWDRDMPDVAIHPDYSADWSASKAAYEFLSWMEKARSAPEAYVDPDQLVLEPRITDGGAAVSAPEDTALIYEAGDTLLHDDGKGMSVSLWFNLTDDLVGATHRNLFAYRDPATGYGFGLSVGNETGTTKHGRLWGTFLTPEHTKNGPALGPVLTNGWHHIIMQVRTDVENADAAWTVWVDGRRALLEGTSVGTSVNWPDHMANAKVSLFTDYRSIERDGVLNIWNSRECNGSIKDLQFFRRPLKGWMAWELAHFNIAPANWTKGKWSFNNVYTDVNGNNPFAIMQVNGTNVGPDTVFVEGPGTIRD